MRRSTFCSDHETVAKAAHRLDIAGFGGIVLDLLAQAVDINHNGIFIDDGFTPDQIIKHILGEDAVDIIEEELHHGILTGGQRDLAVVLIEMQGAGVVGERAGRDQLAGAGQIIAAAADERLDLGAQRDGVEGLGDVIIGTDIEAVEGVDILLAAADDDDRGLMPCLRMASTA